jgi:hypothetical protein
MKCLSICFVCTLLLLYGRHVYPQYGPEYLGWTGQSFIPANEFYNVSQWTANAGGENSCFVTASDTSVDLHWKLTAGKDQWLQCYFVTDEPVSLTSYDIFGFDLHGSVCPSGSPCHTDHVVEIKFEDGIRQASYTRLGEDGILGVDRWINKLFLNKYDESFSIPANFRWDSVRVISFGVKSHPWVDNPEADSGVVSFRNLVGDSVDSWQRAETVDTLIENADTLNKIKENAVNFILSRQQSTGLLTTWSEDGSAWLYGQGLALKALSIDGEWDLGTPMNSAAIAATDLAHFLAMHQEPEGYWPHAWNSHTGAVIVPYENDGSVWMGDMPWMLTGLFSYFKKSGDCSVFSAIEKGKNFLKSLIDPDGSFYTLNVLTHQRIQVTSTEAYAAAIGALLELGEDALASTMISYINAETWDENLKYWREGIYSDRVVLFANTWLGMLTGKRGYYTKSLDAFSLVGKLMYTCGPGEPCGLDGIGPIAVWYEGTLTYIAAGGPGSNTLFNNIKPYINADGSVPHYNDDIGGTAGIWAEKWHSLDGTSWLYFIASKKTPFDPLIANFQATCQESVDESTSIEAKIDILPNPCCTQFSIEVRVDAQVPHRFILYQPNGKVILNKIIYYSGHRTQVKVESLPRGVYYLKVFLDQVVVTKKIIKM